MLSVRLSAVRRNTQIGARSGSRVRRETGAAISYWRFHSDGLSWDNATLTAGYAPGHTFKGLPLAVGAP